MKIATDNDRIRAAISNLFRVIVQETDAGRFDAHYIALALLNGEGQVQHLDHGCSCETCRTQVALVCAVKAGLKLDGVHHVATRDLEIRTQFDA